MRCGSRQRPKTFIERPTSRWPKSWHAVLGSLNKNRGNIQTSSGSGNLAEFYRYRVGDYRVIYRIVDLQLIVDVVTIAHRSEAYE